MRRGFTLIELLIVMAILTVTMAIIVISSGSVSTVQFSMASKDTLRLLRYARNMALQTQQPITLTFAPGVITLQSAFDAETAPQNTPAEERSLADEETKAEASETSQMAKPQGKLVAGDIEDVGIQKYYEGVGFEFIGYNDSITAGRSNTDKKDFGRRVAGEADEEAGERKRLNQETFSITVRANGTTRPFSLRVYDSEGNKEAGNLITVDFLCSAKIEDPDN